MLTFSPFAMLRLLFRKTLTEWTIYRMRLDESGIICHGQCLFSPITIICGFSKKIQIFPCKTKMTTNKLCLGKPSDDATALVIISD